MAGAVRTDKASATTVASPEEVVVEACPQEAIVKPPSTRAAAEVLFIAAIRQGIN